MGIESPEKRSLSPLAWSGLLFAMSLPTISAYLYFLALAGSGTANPTQQLTYTISKIVQFTFPIGFVFFAEGRFPWPKRPRFGGLALGLGFGLLVAGAMFVVYFGVLADSAALAATPAKLRGKILELGVTSWQGYLGLAAFIVVAHSLLEEYYWRWFVFGRLCRGMTPLGAGVLSSLAFMAHHVIVLHVYFPGQLVTLVIPFALAIAFGGAVWAWLFHHTDALGSPWLSHLLVDAAIFVIGWHLVQRAGGLG